MSCPNELMLSMYADGELPADQARNVVVHLKACAHCQALAGALRQENALLKEVLAEEAAAVSSWAATPLPAAPAHETAPRAGGSASSWLWGAIAIAVLTPFMLDWAWQATPSLPTGLRWLGSFGGISGIYSISGGLVSLLAGGQDMLFSSFGFIATSLVVLGTLVMRAVGRPGVAAVAAAAALTVAGAFGAPSRTSAAEFRVEDEGTAKVDADESIDDTVFLGGKTAVVAGEVDGDVFAAAERVEITGRVRGNVYAAGQSVTISGEIGGNVHAAGKNVELDAKVPGSGYLAGQNVTLTEGSELSRGGFLAGETVRSKGKVGRSLYFAADEMELGGNVEAEMHGFGRQVSVTSTGSVGGDLHLTVTSEDAVQIDEGATIGGATAIEIEEGHEHRVFMNAGFYLGVLAKTVALLLIGLLLVTLFPSLRPPTPDSSNQVLRDMGIGFVALLATPIAILMIAFTIIGIPVSIVLAMIYAALVFLSTLVVAYFAAQHLPVLQQGHEALRVGLTLLVILFVVEIPFVGAALSFLIRIFGMGVLIMHLRDLYTRRRGPRDGRPAVETGVLSAT